MKKKTVIIILSITAVLLIAAIALTYYIQTFKRSHSNSENETKTALTTDAETLFDFIATTPETSDETAGASETVAETVKNISFTEEEIAILDNVIKEKCPGNKNSFSLAYLDLTSGYVYEYNAERVYDAASVIKAPWIYSVLSEICAEEKYLEECTTNGVEPDADKIKYLDEKYSLDTVVKYNPSTMYQGGSGEIKNMPSGTEFTYKQLIDYALRHSDCVAYQYLRKIYGYEPMRALATRLGATSLSAKSNGMSAHDATLYFREIYTFVNAEPKYGELMIEPLVNASHLDVFKNALPKNYVMHKYGWDTGAYHEVGIVLGEHPYVLALMSAYDGGGSYVDKFYETCIANINAVHLAAYAR